MVKQLREPCAAHEAYRLMTPRRQPAEPLPILILPQFEIRVAIQNMTQRIHEAAALPALIAQLSLDHVRGNHFDIMVIIADCLPIRIRLEIPHPLYHALTRLLEGVSRVLATTGDSFD